MLKSCANLDGASSAGFRGKLNSHCSPIVLAVPREAEQKLNDPIPSLAIRRRGASWLYTRTCGDTWSRAEVRNVFAGTATARDRGTYEVAIRKDLGSYFNGVNVITLATLLEHVARANKRAVKPEVPDLADLQTVVRLAATAKLESDTVWARATLGELHLGLGHQQEAFDDCSGPESRGSTSARCLSRFSYFNFSAISGDHPAGRGAASQKSCELRAPSLRSEGRHCGGHMIDAPGRTPGVSGEAWGSGAREIAQQLEQWGSGRATSRLRGACGADMLLPKNACGAARNCRLPLVQESMISFAIQCGVGAIGCSTRCVIDRGRDSQSVSAPSDVSIMHVTIFGSHKHARVEAADGKIRAPRLGRNRRGMARVALDFEQGFRSRRSRIIKFS
jgi:hypothetical protein